MRMQCDQCNNYTILIFGWCKRCRDKYSEEFERREGCEGRTERVYDDKEKPVTLIDIAEMKPITTETLEAVRKASPILNLMEEVAEECGLNDKIRKEISDRKLNNKGEK